MTYFTVPDGSTGIPMPDSLYTNLQGQSDYVMKLSANLGKYKYYPRFRFMLSDHNPGASSFEPVVPTLASGKINLLGTDLPWPISSDQFDNQIESFFVNPTTVNRVTVTRGDTYGDVVWSHIDPSLFRFYIIRLKGFNLPQYSSYTIPTGLMLPRHVSTLGDLCIVRGNL